MERPLATSQRQNRPSSLARLVVALLSSLIAVALCEGTLRVFWHNPYRYEQLIPVLRLPIQHARTNYLFNRSAIDNEKPWVRFETDERSYIMPSRRFETPDATVAFLGGSTTECFAVREELRFPARVSYLLEKKGLKVNTLNAAKSGNTTHDSINVLLNHVIQDRPNVVVLMEAWNDIGILKEYMSYASRMGETQNFFHLAQFVLEKASSTFYFMGLLRQWTTSGTLRPNYSASANYNRAVKPLRVEEYENRVRAFVRISRAFGIQPVLMTQPAANYRNALTPDWGELKNQEVFNNIVRKVGVEEDAVVIDLVRYLIENIEAWDQPMKIFYDGVHVNDHGSEVYAEHIAKYLYDEMFVRRLRLTQTGAGNSLGPLRPIHRRHRPS